MAWSGRFARRRGRSDLLTRLFGRRRAGEGGRRAIGLEFLEPRHLLAITITKDNLAEYKVGTDYVFTDTESITVSPGVVVDAAGGKITLTAPVITIGEKVKLLSKSTQGSTDGAITLEAANQTTTAPLSLVNQFYANFASAGGQTASIDVGKGVTISGGDVKLDVVSGDAFPEAWKGLMGEPVIGRWLNQVSNTLNQILALPISIVVKQPESRLTVAEDVSITGSGAIDLNSRAVAQADARARWSVVMDHVQKATKTSGNFSFAAGLAYTDVRSSVSLASGVIVTSTDGDVSVTSDVVNSTTMKARVYLNQGVNPTNPNNVAFSAAVTVQNSISTVSLAAGSTIHAADTVEVKATGTDTNIARPKTSSYKDGLVGVTAGVAVGSSIVEVFANGTIKADRASASSRLQFDPATRVDFATATILLPTSSGLATGDPVVYSAGSGIAIPGLEAGNTYYAVVSGGTTRGSGCRGRRRTHVPPYR